MAKKRLDILLVEKGFAPTRHKAQALIMSGEILIVDKTADKAGSMFEESVEIRIRGNRSRYVSRGGDKLEGALKKFELSVDGLTVLDAGASTGGFTDCLLQNGASNVYAVDVGYGQIDMKLRNDPRVKIYEKINIKEIPEDFFGMHFDLITVDVSFISLLKVFPALYALLAPHGAILALVKPQFEAGRDRIGKGGVVRDPVIHENIVNEVIDGAEKLSLYAEKATFSSLPGPKGNIEFFVLFKKNKSFKVNLDIKSIVSEAQTLTKRQNQTVGQSP